LMANCAPVRDGSVTAYAGTALIMADGTTVGALCVMDRNPRNWTAPQLDVLAALSTVLEREVKSPQDHD
jgi:GAF domain-containing protein